MQEEVAEEPFVRPSKVMVQRARELRRGTTSAEQVLWEHLRGRKLHGRKFRRQHGIGRFVADFYCDDARLIIEVDGAVHEEVDQQERDLRREELLRQNRYHLLRFKNDEVFGETRTVLETISQFVLTHSYSSSPSPAAPGEGAGG